MGVFGWMLFFIVIACMGYLIYYREMTRREEEEEYDIQNQSRPSPYASWEEINQMEKLAQLKKEVQVLQSENTSLSSENQRMKEALKKRWSNSEGSIAEQLYLKNTINDLQKDVERLQKEKSGLLYEKNHFAEDKAQKYWNTTITNLSKEIDLLQKKNENLLRENSNYIKENKELSEVLHEFNPYDDYRKRFPSPYRCDDGDWVRSKAEREIDNFFYRHRIWHIIEEVYYKKHSDVKYYPDFYLPDYNLYLEYFGGTDNEYLFKREAKIATYRADPSIRFEYLTFQDDARIEERLREICRKYSIRL